MNDQNRDAVTPPSTDLSDWEADALREIDERRDMLGHLLADARVAITKAIREVEALTGDSLYDVEIVEGDGQYAAAALRQMLVTLAGVRTATVDAGR